MNVMSVLNVRIGKIDPHHAAIMKGMVTVAAFVFLGKLVSAAKEMAVAYRYGLGPEVDAYQFLYTLISWPIGIWSSVLTAVLVPLALRLRADDQRQLPSFRAELLGLAMLVGVALALVTWVAIHTMLARGAGGLPAASAPLARAALPGLVLLLPLGVLTALHSAWMLSAGRHLNTLLDCIPTLFIAAFVLLVPGAGVQALVWGTVAGCAAQLLALLVPMARRRELDWPRMGLSSPHWPLFWQGFGIMLAGQALMSLTAVIDQFYAVGLGTGAIATLGYASRIQSLILSLGAIAVARATLPVFAQAGSADPGRIRDVARHWVLLMFIGGLLVALVSHAVAPWAVRLLFERGQFSAADTATVTRVLRYGLPQMPFYFSSMVLVSYALSQRRFGLIFWSGVIGCASKVVGNVLLVPLLGVNGIALSATLVYALNELFFWLALIAWQPSFDKLAGLCSRTFKRWFK